MKLYLLSIFLSFLFVFSAQGQCLTDFSKLLPESHLDFSRSFGQSLSMYDDYMAVGIPNSDSLGRLVGSVEIYKKNSSTEWTRIATLAPSDPREALQFGWNVQMSHDYLLVSTYGYGGKVYVFKKPTGDWISQTELVSFTVANSMYFGNGNDHPFDISEDQQTIAITDGGYAVSAVPPYQFGAVFTYHRQSTEEWNSTMVPTRLPGPASTYADFGVSGVSFFGNRIFTGSPLYNNGNGAFLIYKDSNGDFSNPVLEATLTDTPLVADFAYRQFVVTSDGLFTSVRVDPSANSRYVMSFYEKPPSGNWSDSFPACYVDLDSDLKTPATSNIALSTNGTDIYASYHNAIGTGYFMLLKKGAGWCDPIKEIIETSPAPDPQVRNFYGLTTASNQSTNVVMGYAALPQNSQAYYALKVFSKNPDLTWGNQYIFPLKITTTGDSYGSAVIGFDDYMFVGSPRNSELKPFAGKVIMYKKSAGTWAKTGEIIPLAKKPFDDNFGTALAANNNYMAIGASGFDAHGKVFIYKKTGTDWSSPQLVQEISLPENILTVSAYGDHLAMSDNWLLIPYLQNAPLRIMLALYKFNGGTWGYMQAMEVGIPPGLLSSITSTFQVDIEDNTIVAGGSIIELNDQGVWESKYALSPSDPEYFHYSPDFTHVIANGSLFGFSCEINDNTIFVGAPTKDYAGTWDVGAVYVYVRKPGEPWSSTTETAKIVPRVQAETELFGFSLKALHNTLIAGAIGADLTTTEVATNKPGRAYIFQSADYYWQQITPLIDFTGDSFNKDYFGYSVSLAETDFFISAPLEDIPTGKLSGSVYVTPTPPLVKLVPPVCVSQDSIALLGYPFGGSWTGPGLKDASKGIFDPAMAGIGTHELTYTTASCAHLGKLLIQVSNSVPVIFNNDSLYRVCKNSAISIPLSVKSPMGGTYQWYYRPDSLQLFAPYSSLSSIAAKQKGEYKVEVDNSKCESYSNVVRIKEENISLTISPLPLICEYNTAGSPLKASPSGGFWGGAGVVGNTFFPVGLSTGSYPINYNYKSGLNCLYEQTTTVNVINLQKPAIQRSSGNLCAEGKVELKLTTTFPPEVDFYWQKKQMDGSTSALSTGPTVSVNEAGTYRVVIRDDICEKTSDELTINDTFVLQMSPQENSALICGGNSFLYSFNDVSGVTYSWYYSPSQNQGFTSIVTNSTGKLQANNSGYYKAIAVRGVCSFESPVKQLIVQGRDSVFIPNIFTPNGDGKNDEFQVYSSTSDVSLMVINRYGETVFIDEHATKWDGGSLPSGIYYWLATYSTCVGERKTIKGFVQLAR